MSERLNPMSDAVLKVQDYTVEFWVDGVWYPAAVSMNFEVQAGNVLAIVGESGSGIHYCHGNHVVTGNKLSYIGQRKD